MDQQPQFVYVGTYTTHEPELRGRGEGIYVYQFNPDTGGLAFVSLAADVPNPSFLTVHPDRRTLFAANETSSLDGEPFGAVSAFAIDNDTGGLTFLNRQPSHGTDPCYASVDRTGRNVLVANYTSGSIAVLPVTGDGRLQPAADIHQHRGSGPNQQRQKGPHAHFIAPDATNRFVMAADLGLDQVLVYELDAVRGVLIPNDPPAAPLPPGSGPRHLAFHPYRPFVYIINELASTITTCAWDREAGTLHALDTITTLPRRFDGRNSCAEILIGPSGNVVYGSNRGHDSIAILAIDPTDGTLIPHGHVASGGANPRNFTIDPSGNYLLVAHQDSDTIVTFRIDASTGDLMATGQTTNVPSPVCIAFQSRG